MDLNNFKKGNKHFSPVASVVTSEPLWLKRITSLANRDISFSIGLNNRQKERFFSEMGILLAAGVDLQTVLELANKRDERNKKISLVYKSILQDVTKGLGLSEAMQHTGQFTGFDCYSVMIGENTGELSLVFNRLNAYYSKAIAQKRKITSALSYPIIVLITTFAAISFMLKFVVPMFADTLIRFGGELPPITKFVINCSEHLSSFLFFTLAILILLFAYYYRNKNKPNVRAFASKILLSLPFLGKVIHKSYLFRFTQAMDLLLSAKVGLVESIDLTQKMINFYPLSVALSSIKTDLLQGSFFYKSIEKQTFFDPSIVTLVKIGEEVNQLDKIFEQLSKQYEQEIEYKSSVLLTVLEPLMILLLALIVGTILIAMYLPMFKIGTIIR